MAIIIITGLVIASSVIWVLQSPTSNMDIFQVSVLSIIVAFALFIAIRRLKNARRGEPTEDELSKKMLQKTAAISFYVSLYLWVFLIYLKDRITFDTEELLGLGVLGMAITFAITWIILNVRGLKNE